MARRPAGPGPDERDADLFASPDEILAELAEAARGDPAPGDALDLHHFAPRECADVVAAYLDAARAAGLREVRIIHGKGTGALRRTVHAVLARHPAVHAHRLLENWGATWVELRPA
ncbi:MAG TPA: Smr/MutS family protein [Kofleriaceae bacterium]|nr:Smr/MutS family protein [Kofleriaceae bacterium]